MRIETKITGTSPIIMHNPQLANPDHPISRAIAQITGKRKKTEEDRIEVARLEFAGGLYIDEKGPYVPSHALRRCLQEAGKSRRLGTVVTQAAIIVDFTLPLEFSGPTTIDDLYDQPQYRNYVSVGVNSKRIMRMRPQFPQWGLTAHWVRHTQVRKPRSRIRPTQAPSG